MIRWAPRIGRRRQMDDAIDFFADADVPRAWVALLLSHFSRLSDEREPWRIAFPLAEVLLLLTCATIASCDDFDEIAAWGRQNLLHPHLSHETRGSEALRSVLCWKKLGCRHIFS